MSELNKLLDKIKETRSIASDNALAAAIGVSRQRVSAWRHGTNLPDPVACATIAGLSGEPLARVLGIVGEARAISREEKAVWHKLAASAAVLFVVLGATTLPGVGARDAQAGEQSASGHEKAAGLYIMRSYGRSAAQGFLTVGWLLALWLKWKFSPRKAGPDCIEAFAC